MLEYPDRTQLLVTPEALAEELRRGEQLSILDVRWRLDQPDGRAEYRDGHLPGAVYVDLDTELAELGEPSDGRHPLPGVERLQAAARRWGLTAGSSVVVYDNLSGLSAARAWWLLRYAGLARVRVLDGGYRAWTRAGLPIETTPSTPIPGDVVLAYGSLPVIDIAQAAQFSTRGTLLDARAAERYRGDTEPIDPRAGHVPGAVSAPVTETLDENGQFKSAAELRDWLLAHGVHPEQPVGVYCGSGVTASTLALAATLAGFEPQLYPGSWSQWSNHPDRPVAVGDAPG